MATLHEVSTHNNAGEATNERRDLDDQLSLDDLAQPPGSPKKMRGDGAPQPPKPKYEMNLAEFPITTLSKRKPDNIRIIEYHDTIIGKDGAKVERTWTVSPSPRYGFGSTELIATIFELFQVWREQGFTSRTIQFGSIYNLLKRMGIKTTEQRAYERLRNDLSALVEISIEAKNAFWDNEKKAYESRIFHLFDSIHLYHRDPRKVHQDTLPFSSITASETLWHSIESNAIITLSGVAPQLFHALTPTEQRLALYLTKMLHHKHVHYRDVDTLASQIPGIRLRRDSWVSVMYAEELNSTTSSVTLQRTDRHGILGQKPSGFQESL